MSDIEILEEYLDKQDRKFVSEHRLMILQAIENLIQENKELKEHLEKYYNGELFTAKQLKSIEENQKKYFIHKSKVKEKIEVLKMKADYDYKDVIKILQELLEEGDK